MLETAHAAMRPWPLFSHESFGHVLMLDSYMHACDRSMGAIELHDPTCCFMSVGKPQVFGRLKSTTITAHGKLSAARLKSLACGGGRVGDLTATIMPPTP